jgi:hypothetical protein
MSADSPEALSVAEIGRRLSAIREGEAHLRTLLPLESPYNAILRLRDVTRYIGLRENEVFLWFPTMTRLKMPHRRRERPPPAKATPLPPERQWDFTRFFRAWDAGLVVKARVGDEWGIVGRHSALAQVAAAPRKTIEMRIDRETLGLRFK